MVGDEERVEAARSAIAAQALSVAREDCGPMLRIAIPYFICHLAKSRG